MGFRPKVSIRMIRISREYSGKAVRWIIPE